MHKVILPYNATVIHNGKLFVNELVPGDVITGYDLKTKMLRSVPLVEVTPVEQLTKRLLMLDRHHKAVCFVDETIGLTTSGPKSLAERPVNFIGFCRHNPKVLTLRKVVNVVAYTDIVPAFLLKWDNPAYIWAEGILVGSPE
jgi:hypothetical protein